MISIEKVEKKRVLSES